jgi:hypothetical protein
MEKFIYIPVVDLGNQLVSVANVKLIYESESTAKETLIHYNDGTVTKISHDDDTDYSVLLALQNALVASLQKSWTNVAPVTLSLNVEVTSITNYTIAPEV